jgi:trehalose 6-phosphate synthase/phosphatase
MAEGKLIVVSNRLPLSVKRGPEGWVAEPSSGGLASAVNPILKQRAASGSAGRATRPRSGLRPARRLLEGARKKHGFVTVDLPAGAGAPLLRGLSRTRRLWPLFHNFATNFEGGSGGWTAYVTANRRFRDAVLEHLEPGDTVWVHDYHLMLLPRPHPRRGPRGPRRLLPAHPVSPPRRPSASCPPGRGPARLLGADLVAFQTHLDLQHFRSSLLRVLGCPARWTAVTAQGSSTRLGCAAHRHRPRTSSRDTSRRTPGRSAPTRHCGRRYRGRRILLGVDRLDYTKGIPERLRAYRKLLQRAPHLRGQIVLVQVAVPSRERIPEYDRPAQHR